MNSIPTQRFSSRAPYYHQHRPRYPRALIDLMTAQIGLTPASIIADIGAGTGISSELFLQNGNMVYAIEPNSDMRAVAAQAYAAYPDFILSDGSAEVTGLADSSVDYVLAGQAFHWFDPDKALIEFRRILKPLGWMVIVWNTRRDDLSPFMREYNALLEEFDTEKGATPRVTQGEQEQMLVGFTRHTTPNNQLLNWDGLLGRALSASYIPLPGQPSYAGFEQRLHSLFDRYQHDGHVEVLYETEIMWGQVE